MSPQPPKGKSTGKRKFHSKSRNGCSTCKRRRIKCDEQRPICKKCQHMNLPCGYTLVQPQQNTIPSPPNASNEAFDINSSGSMMNASIANKMTQSMSALGPFNERSIDNDLMGPNLKKQKLNIPYMSNEDLAVQQQTPSVTPIQNTADETKPGLGATNAQSNPSFGVLPAAAAVAAATAVNAATGAGQASKLPFYASLLNAGNLNNINMSHLVNNLSGLGDLSSLGNLSSLSSLATLAHLPIDLSNLSSLLDTQSGDNPLAIAAGAFLKAGKQNEQVHNATKPNQEQNSDVGREVDETVASTSASSSSSETQTQTQTQPATAAAAAAAAAEAAEATERHIHQAASASIASGMMGQQLSGMGPGTNPELNMLDLKLMFHYTSQVSSTITGAGISDTNIWSSDIPMLAFEFPFLMHSLLAFSATHLSRTEKGLDQCVTSHRGDALRLLREEVLNINANNTDALVASALILIMDSLANASYPSSTSPKSLPASAWIFHVKGAATILTAVWPLTESSRFHKFISVDLSDLGDIINHKVDLNSDKNKSFANLECHDSDIADLFPVEIGSPYLITLAYLNKLHKERYKSDFILRIFAFPALLDKTFLSLLMTGDVKAMRIMRSYYKLLRSFCSEMKDKVWFLEGVSNILPVDVEEYAGGAGGMHMMLDFLGGGPTIVENEIDEEIDRYDLNSQISTNLTDPNNLPSEITSNLDIMGDNSFLDIK